MVLFFGVLLFLGVVFDVLGVGWVILVVVRILGIGIGFFVLWFDRV